MKKRKNNNKYNWHTIIITIALVIYGLCFNSINSSFGLNTVPTSKILDDLKVTFIDVGQADCILVENNNEYMLIDAGNNEDGDKLVQYFQSLNINKFQYIVGTHPHEDHIGGMDNIINNFTVDNIYMPDVITTTATFEEVIDAASKKDTNITIPKIGESISLGDAIIKVIYTGTDNSDLNDTSIVLKLIYGNTSFLFTGDATDEVEKLILNSDIEATVLKVGHHGSKYSSTNSFLKKVNPQYAVISVGNNNSYNHPANETLNKLEQLGINTYRTDKLGTIIITSDGSNIKINNYKTDTNGE